MSEAPWFERLRFLLGEAPSEAVWRALLDHVEEAPAEQEAVGLAYAWDHLEGWPVELRATPPGWLLDHVPAGTAPGVVLLGRAWRIDWHRLTLERVGALLEGLAALRARVGAAPGWGVPARLEMNDAEVDVEALTLLLRAPGFEQLQTLSLSDAYLDVAGDGGPVDAARVDSAMAAFAEALGGLGQLRALELRCVGLAPGWLLGAPWWPRLERLALEGMPLTGALRRQLLARTSSALRDLDLSQCALDDGAASPLEGAPAPGGLRRLRLRGVGLGWRGAAALLRGAPMPALRELALDHNAVRSRGLHALARTPWLDALEVLELSWNHITAGGLRALAKGRRRASLHTLRLAGNDLRGGGLRALAQGEALPALRCLDLRDTRLEPDALKALPTAPWRHTLEALDLAQNPGLDLAAFLPTAHDALTRLQRLDLNACGLTDDHLPALLQSPLLRQLHLLTLHYNAITDRGARMLTEALTREEHPVLRLSLAGNPLSAEGRAALQGHPTLSA